MHMLLVSTLLLIAIASTSIDATRCYKSRGYRLQHRREEERTHHTGEAAEQKKSENGMNGIAY